MTDIAKKLKNASQDAEVKIKTEKDHAEGKPPGKAAGRLIEEGLIYFLYTKRS
jgi:hypothetical protein